MAGIGAPTLGSVSTITGQKLGFRPARPQFAHFGSVHTITGQRLNFGRPQRAPKPIGAARTAAPATTPTSSAAQPGSGGGSGSAQTDQWGNPLDSTALNNIALHGASTGESITGLQQQEAYDNTALQAALGQLAYQQPRDQLRMMQQANARGGLYSSVEGQNQGNLVHSYAARANGLTASNAERIAALNEKIAGLRSGENTYDFEQGLASAGRLSTQAANNPPASAPGTATVGKAAAKGAKGGRGNMGRLAMTLAKNGPRVTRTIKGGGPGATRRAL